MRKFAFHESYKKSTNQRLDSSRNSNDKITIIFLFQLNLHITGPSTNSLEIAFREVQVQQ